MPHVWLKTTFVVVAYQADIFGVVFELDDLVAAMYG